MPARLADIERAARAVGLDVLKPKGKHSWKARRASDGVTYPIPAHNGTKTEIANKYIDGLCRAFGLDVSDFKNRL